MGGLLTLEEISLLTTVFEKVESVLLARNLKSYTRRSTMGFNLLSRASGDKDLCSLCQSCSCFGFFLSSLSLFPIPREVS
jgi:hypothetical protein